VGRRRRRRRRLRPGAAIMRRNITRWTRSEGTRPAETCAQLENYSRFCFRRIQRIRQSKGRWRCPDLSQRHWPSPIPHLGSSGGTDPGTGCGQRRGAPIPGHSDHSTHGVCFVASPRRSTNGVIGEVRGVGCLWRHTESFPGIWRSETPPNENTENPYVGGK